MYSGIEFQMRAADGTKDLLWLTRLERGIWTAKSCDLTERLRRDPTEDVQEAADKAVPGPLHNTYGGTM